MTLCYSRQQIVSPHDLLMPASFASTKILALAILRWLGEFHDEPSTERLPDK